MDFIKSIFSRTIIGLDIGVSGIKAVELNLGKKVSLAAYNRITFPWDTLTPEGVVKNESVIISALKKLFSNKNFSTQKVSVGIFGNSILSRQIQLPQMAVKDIKEQIYWEAEQYIPFNIEECTLDFAVIGNVAKKVTSGTDSQLEVLLVAAKKDYVEEFSSLVESAGLTPVVVDYQSFALGNAFEFNYRQELSQSGEGETDVIVDFGAGSTKLTFIERQNTVHNVRLNPSGFGCSQLISERIGESIEDAERAKLTEPNSPLIAPVIHDYNQLLVSEAQRNIDVFFTHSPERHLRKIFYCGGVSRTPGLIEELNNRYPAQIEDLDPIKSVFAPSTGSNGQLLRDLKCFGSVAVGLALRSPGDAK
jgi:type IV pilus assembly protein PilM